MTHTARIQVSTNPGRGLAIERITPKLSRIVTPNKDQIIFWMGHPLAVCDGAYLYMLEGIIPSAHGLLTKHWPDMARLFLPINDFDYAIGQALSKAGLMLVRRLDA